MQSIRSAKSNASVEMSSWGNAPRGTVIDNASYCDLRSNSAACAGARQTRSSNRQKFVRTAIVLVLSAVAQVLGVDQWLTPKAAISIGCWCSQTARVGMPEVGLFESSEPNAFATGARRDGALVAVSAGLFHHLGKREPRRCRRRAPRRCHKHDLRARAPESHAPAAAGSIRRFRHFFRSGSQRLASAFMSHPPSGGAHCGAARTQPAAGSLR
jgi:hypothetical protein